jgi:predicted transcriptional regulator
MYLTTSCEKICGTNCYRSWKGLDWDIMNRLHEKGYIGNPVNKSKSVSLTEEGFQLSKELFKEYFGK